VPIDPLAHRPDRVRLGFPRGFAVLLVDRGDIERLRGPAQPVTAQRRDVGNEAVPADHHHALHGDLKTEDAVFVESHWCASGIFDPEPTVFGLRVRTATSV
jgi:hypothetical protein